MRPRQFAHLGGQDAYEILGVGRTATRAQIDSARRALVKKLHPDLPTGDAERMSLVNAAAAVLLDEDQRRDYDAYVSLDRGPASRWRVGPRRGTPPAAPAPRDASSTPTRYATPPSPRGTVPGSGRPSPPGTPPAAPRRDRRPPSPRPAPAGAGVDDVLQRPRRRSAETLDAQTLYRTGAARVTPPGAPRRPSPRPGYHPAAPPYPQLRWQPPPPGRIAVWRERRRVSREIARGQRTAPSGGPMVVLMLFATLVVICAVGGAWIGYTTEFSGGSHQPAPVSTHSTPARSPSAKPKPKPSSKPSPKPSRPRTPSASPRR